MENFKTPKHFLFKEGFEGRHLHTVFTQMGKKTVYDSAVQCNKCAYCGRTCPAQLETGREDCGPRARNLLLRFIMEGKINFKENPARVREVLSGCMLCGLCTKECFAKVPAHEHVLELERTYGHRKLPLSYRLKKKIIPLKSKSLKQKIKKIELGGNNAFFLPSFEAKFLEVSSALNTLRAVKKIFSGVKILWNGCGVYEYVYAPLPAARKAAQKLIEEYFAAAPAGDKKIVTDSLDIFNFIKKYPQLFYETEHFDRAQKLAANILFIADVLPRLDKTEKFEKIIFTKTAAFSAEDEIFKSSINLLSRNKNFLPSWNGENYPLPQLGYEHIKPKESALYLRRKIDFIKAAGADAAVTASLNSKRRLNKYLKKYYPKCRAIYIGDLYADEQTHG